MATDRPHGRDPINDILGMWSEPLHASLEAMIMTSRLAATPDIPRTNPQQVVLIPGAGSFMHEAALMGFPVMDELAVMQYWLTHKEGFMHVDIAKIHTVVPILPEVNGLIKQLEEYGKKTHLVGISQGGFIGYLTALLRPDLVESQTIIDGPVVKTDVHDYNFWTTRWPLTDIHTNQDIETLLQANVLSSDIPVTLYSSQYNRSIISPRALRHKDIQVKELPVYGHNAMQYSWKVAMEVAKAIRATSR